MNKMQLMQPPLSKRLLLLLAAFTIHSLYIPTSLLLEGGIEPKLPWDVFPLVVWWVIPYVLCFPLWALAIVWLAWKKDEHHFLAAIASLFLTFSLGISIFILFPTYVVLPQITGTDMLSKLLMSLQVSGGDHDAFPSSHVYITTLLALFYNKWYPRWKWLWLAVVLIISLSTLFTRQHYILDVLGGITIAWLGYRFGLWWAENYTKYINPACA